MNERKILTPPTNGRITGMWKVRPKPGYRFANMYRDIIPDHRTYLDKFAEWLSNLF